MSGQRAHICSFQAIPDVKRRTTYQALKSAALKVGRFSVFEATANQYAAALFTRLCRDPEIETIQRDFPWTEVRLRAGRPR